MEVWDFADRRGVWRKESIRGGGRGWEEGGKGSGGGEEVRVFLGSSGKGGDMAARKAWKTLST